jgi:uncharacterized protein YdaU (DUF1376 family)
MSGPQFMPLYIGDYLRDTQHLTTEQHGAYFLLICACWSQGGFLPDDDIQLAAITRLSIDAWKVARRTLAKFFKISGQKWRQKRVRVELDRAQYLHEVRSKAGSKGGSKTKARARVLQPQPQPQPSVSSSLRSSEAELLPPSAPPSQAKGGRVRGFVKKSPRTIQAEAFYLAALAPSRNC